MPQLNTYDIGDAVVLTAEFWVAGVLTAPANPVVKVRDPNGTITTYSGSALFEAAPGVYQVTVLPAVAGEWTWRAAGTGAAYGAKEGHLGSTDPAGRFIVTASAFV